MSAVTAPSHLLGWWQGSLAKAVHSSHQSSSASKNSSHDSRKNESMIVSQSNLPTRGLRRETYSAAGRQRAMYGRADWFKCCPKCCQFRAGNFYSCSRNRLFVLLIFYPRIIGGLWIALGSSSFTGVQ